MESLYRLKIDRGSVDSEGPDLGALIVAPAIAANLSAHKVFYNLQLRQQKLLEKPPRLVEGVWFLNGFVAEGTKEEIGRQGYEKIKGFLLFSGAAGVDTEYERDGYDYFDVPITYTKEFSIPRDFGGMSGGGLWQVPLIKKRSTGKLQHEELLFSGVVFYQQPIRDNESMVRCHGRRSVYEIAYDAIRDYGSKTGPREH